MTSIDSIKGEPVIGQTYMVRSVMAKIFSQEEPVPVIGTAHSDKAYGFGEDKHWHLDYRFLSERIYQGFVKQVRAEDAMYVNDKAETVLRYVVDHDNVDFEERAVKRPFKYLRKMPVYPIQSCNWMVEALSKFAGKKIDPKRPVCPHRGVCLRGMQTEKNAIVCPGHGLAWDSKTGAYVDRLH